MMRGGLNHLALTVKDPQRSIGFYDEVLTYMGYRKLRVSDEVQQDMKTELYAWGGAAGVVRLRPPKPGHEDARHERRAPGLNHFSFNAASREDVDGLHALLVKMGAEILDPPANYIYLPDNYAVYFLDPDGIKLEYAFSTELG
jgi:catechol 2,3-dioxygenase-like lactoylglutathione lyase family enzyme